MSSTRLPGKVMAPILGEPMLGRQVERLRRCKRIDALTVATSDGDDDAPIAAYCERLGLPVYRGSLHDVLDRYRNAALAFGPSDAIVRLTADCPLADWDVIDQVIDTHMAGGYDHTNNTSPERTYPHGLDAEAVRPEVLEIAWREARDPYEREHVTPFVYRRPERFRLGSLINPDPAPELRWTVDTPEDLAFVREVYERLYPSNPAFGSADIKALPRNSSI